MTVLIRLLCIAKTGVVFISSSENATPISLILLGFVQWMIFYYYSLALFYCWQSFLEERKADVFLTE
jgi:hypothetical protein